MKDKMYLFKKLRAAQCRDTRIHSYSGRAMYGKKCLALSGDPVDCRNEITETLRMMFAEAIDTVRDGTENEGYDATDELYEGLDILMNYKTDSLGLGVVLYWPGMDPPPHEDEYDG